HIEDVQEKRELRRFEYFLCQQEDAGTGRDLLRTLICALADLGLKPCRLEQRRHRGGVLPNRRNDDDALVSGLRNGLASVRAQRRGGR
ncbi:MAG TPA: hypothetical protein VKB08_09725, partial [Bradyrhizobium sp.]|nr:hypothetical protein [Bradyrhizobium sp.]